MTDTAAEPHEHPVDPERVAHARARGLSAEDAAGWRGCCRCWPTRCGHGSSTPWTRNSASGTWRWHCRRRYGPEYYPQ